MSQTTTNKGPLKLKEIKAQLYLCCMKEWIIPAHFKIKRDQGPIILILKEWIIHSYGHSVIQIKGYHEYTNVKTKFPREQST